MKNAILIGGALAAVLAMNMVSYRVGVTDGRSREATGKCFSDLIAEMAVLTTFVHKFDVAMKDAK